VTVVAIPSQPALLMRPCVSFARPSVLSPRASRAILHSRHPADCILPILVRKLAVGVFPATAIPNRLLRCHGIFLSLKYFPDLGGAAIWAALRTKTRSSRAVATHSTARASCAYKGSGIWAVWAAQHLPRFIRPKHWMSIIHISVSLLNARGVCQSDGRKDTVYLSTVAVIHSYQDWKDKSCDRRRG